VKKDMKIVPVSTVDEVLPLALTQPLTAVEWDEAAYEAEQLAARRGDPAGEGLVTH